MHRRTFLATSLGALASSASPAPAPRVKFGVDLFSIRSQKWTPFQYLDYCAKHGVEVVHFSEIRFIGGLEEEHLKRVRAHAEKLGIEIEIGMMSICPTSKMFRAADGTAEEQLTRMIRAANVVGSKIIRCVLGSSADRQPPLGIEGNIESTVKVLRAVRSRVMDAGLKIAIENHAGDMQAREMKMLIEEAGKDFVGACLDSGNPVWAIEDPHLTLETLAPYVLTSHVRDSAVWATPNGAAVAWTRMGEGNIGIDDYVRKYAELCPGKALSLEIIVTGPREFNYHDPKFWEAYRNMPAWEFARFVALVQKGTPRPAPPRVPREDAAAREREDLEVSIAYTKELLKKIAST
ncbi:MAG TPA: sugar phosphate isomerase/epimerase [Bryobacteraceae bacterium]|nr:sugar phosphate isomerase/epimerase [Bryobacteraceae bacterium]HOQ46702.1 sugar phosphate isomerase/epimerase [Bryobacteraceae bacterium]HPU72372.1 sugar phosphate isomerase/epimerase [Bryobacteraceae bacterium]